MQFPSKDVIEQLRKEYPIGTKVEFVKMDDKFAPPIGTQGTVYGVDDTGSILVKLSNGSSLSVIHDEDVCKKLD